MKRKLPQIQIKYKVEDNDSITVRTSNDAYKTLLELYNPDTINYTESVIVLFLNRRNATIGWYQLSSGCTHCALIDKKVLFAVALKCGASGIIVSHNHPSGNLQPSTEDKNITEAIKAASNIIDIPLLDHLIISEKGYYSFSDEGYI